MHLRRITWYLGLVLAAVVFAWVKARTYPTPSVFGVSFYMGKTAESLRRHGTMVTTVDLGTTASGLSGIVLPLAAHRRPLIPIFLALVSLVSQRVFVALLVKNLLVFFLLAATWRAVRREAEGGRKPLFILGTVFIVCLPSWIAQIIAPEIEEGYLTPLVCWLVAIALQPSAPAGAVRRWMVPLALGAVVLTKSSMLGPAIVLACVQGRELNRPKAVLRNLSGVTAALIIVLIMNGTWSGRWTTASSLDWYNIYKGNAPQTKVYYAASALDQMPIDVPFRPTSEWEFSEGFKRLALDFVSQHPAAFLELAGLKAYNLFLRVDFSPTDQNFARRLPLRVLWLLGNLLFRALFLSALALAVRDLLRERKRPRSKSFVGAATFLLFVIAYAAPYVVGFAYLRHAVVLACPSLVFLVTRRRDEDVTISFRDATAI